MATEILPIEVKAKLQRGDDFLLLDVRELHEYKACNIPQALHIPLGEIPRRLHELEPSRQIVVHCKAGMRSAKACAFLRENGYANVLNMRGGIDAW